MALIKTLSSVVRLPLHVVGKVVTTATALLPGHGAKAGPTPAPAPTDAAPPAPTPVKKPASKPTPKPAAKGPVEPASTGPTPDPAAPVAPVKKAAAEKAPAAKKAPAAEVAEPATKAPAAKLPAPVVEPEPAPVTSIDADALDDEVDVTPADIAATMGSQLDDESTQPS